MLPLQPDDLPWRFTRRALAASFLGIGAGASIGLADQTPSAKALTPTMVKTGLFMISGGGSNSVLRLSGNGFIFVDSKLPGYYEAISAVAEKVSFSDQPIRILINTDYHSNHSGNNAKFLRAGAGILAHENTARRLGLSASAGSRGGGTIKTFDREFGIGVGGVEVKLFHFGKARTDGDAIVYFPDLKVIAVGDLFGDFPDIDFSAGGSLVGWGPVLNETLKLDFDVVIPGAGSILTKADLAAFKAKIDALTARAVKLVRQGTPRDRLMTQLNANEFGWRFNSSNTQLDHFYADLSRAK